MTRVKTALIILALAMAAAGCGNRWNVDYVHDQRSLSNIQVIGILPFQNLTEFDNAGNTVADLFFTELSALNRFRVIGAGAMRKLIEAKMKVLPPIVDRAYCYEIGRELKLDAVLFGAVEEYSYRRGETAGNDVEPAVCISMRLVSTTTGTVIWSSSRSRSSYEFLSMERDPVTHIAQRIVHGMVDEMKGVLEP